MTNKIEQHKKICLQLNETYSKKNHDYGDSFGESIKEWGILSAATRISDKYNRFKSLVKISNDNRLVVDESLGDTLLDMANYCIMTYMELNENE